MILAVTGGTGFVGGQLLGLATARSDTVRALARRPQPAQPGVTWIAGDLADPAALKSLCAGADATIHIAGVVNTRSRAEFDAGNVAGTAAMLAAAAAAGVRRFVHVSSLSAREPGLSDYGASKHAAETLVAASPLDWTIVRPPGVYGPGDRDLLAVFRMVARGLAIVPGDGRFSLIEVSDLARALLALCAGGGGGATFEIDDGGGGYSHAELARAIGVAVGRRPRLIRLPSGILALGAAVDTAIAWTRRRLPRLSFDRARYLAHSDWVVAGCGVAAATWAPAVPLAQGLAATVAWYRAAGWLRG